MMVNAPANTYMAYCKVKEERVKKKKLILDLDVFTNSLGSPMNLLALDISAAQIVSNRPYIEHKDVFYTDGVYRNLISEDLPLSSQSRYGVGSGAFSIPKAKNKMKLKSPLHIQDLDHMNALINASVQTNIMIDTNTLDPDRINNLWSFVLLRVGDNRDVEVKMVKKYRKSMGYFPSTYILRSLGYDGILRSMDEYEFLPQCIMFNVEVGLDSVNAKFEY